MCIETGNFDANGGIYWSYVDAFALTKSTTTSTTYLINNGQFKVYPNPSKNGIINLISDGEGKVYIYNQFGLLVYSGTITNISKEFDLSEEFKGFYIVSVKSKNGDYSQKIMIE